MEMLDLRDDQYRPLSPLFLYYHSRNSPGALGQVLLRNAFRVAAKRGVCRLSVHNPAVSVKGALEAPSAVAEEDAKEQKLVAFDSILRRAGYYSVHFGNRLERWRGALLAGQPIVLGFWTQTSYWSGEGILANESAPHQGAHCAVVVGFDDVERNFTVRDSRGTGFATQGEWPLSYDVASSRRMIESWTLETITYN